MQLSGRERQHQEQVTPSTTPYYYTQTGTSAYTLALTVQQTNVIVTLSDDTDNATLTITLPSVAEAKGRTFLIRVAEFSGGVTIQDRDDSIGDWTNLTADADGEYAELHCTGEQWIVVVTDI